MSETPEAAPKHASILDAAERLFLRYGYKKTTIDEVAQEAGVGKGTIYSYFKGKDELLLAYADRCLHAIHARADEAARVPGPFRERLARYMGTLLLGVWDRIHAGAHGEEVFNGLAPTVVERQKACLLEQQQQIRRLLVEATAVGALDVPDLDRTAVLVWRAFKSFAPPYSVLTGDRAEIARGIEDMAALIARGLR